MLDLEAASYYLKFAEPNMAEKSEVVKNHTFETLQVKLHDIFVDLISLYPHLGIKVFLDGVGAAGKGKLTESLQAFGFEAISFGSMARGLTRYALEQGYLAWKSTEEKQEKVSEFVQLIPNLQVLIEQVGIEKFIVINQYKDNQWHEAARYNMHTDLGDVAVTQNISFIAGLEAVCDLLDTSLIEMTAKTQHIVLDGRDNVARRTPTEEEFAYKLAQSQEMKVLTYYVYVFAEQEARIERAKKRRVDELQRKGIQLSEEGMQAELEGVAQSIIARDYGDITRTKGALMSPEKARVSDKYQLFFDTTNYSIEEMDLLFLANLLAHVFPSIGLLLLEEVELYFEVKELTDPTQKTSSENASIAELPKQVVFSVI